MNLPIVEMDKEEAAERAAAYRTIAMPTEEEKGILAGYLAASAGKKLINLRDAMAQGGVDERGWPKLAVMGATEQFCYLRANKVWGEERGQFRFAPVQSFSIRGGRTRGIFEFEIPIVGDVQQTWGSEYRSMVPICPPDLRPRHGSRHLHLSNFVVLWEVEEWEKVPAPPGDPALLRHLHGDLYTVEAEWDLTELERAVLAGRNR